MSGILRTTLLGLFFGTFGTTLGGILGIVIKKNSNKFLSFILSFASGLMMSVICFDLIPEALGISSIYGVTNVLVLHEAKFETRQEIINNYLSGKLCQKL